MERAGPVRIAPQDTDRVLVSAARLFARYGFDGVGIRQIAQESDVKPSSIYYHFGSKAELFDEALDYTYASVIHEYQSELPGRGCATEKLHALIGLVFDKSVSDHTYLMTVQRDLVAATAKQNSPRLFTEYTKMLDMFQSLLDEHFGTPCPSQHCLGLLSMILGFCELTAATSEHTAKHEGGVSASRKTLLDLADTLFLRQLPGK